MVPAVLTLDPLESPSLGGVMSIGRFARRAGLSIGALRHYAEIGLLVPARVDPDTGYRYYTEEQLAPARRIALLRDLDVPLDLIRTLRDATPDELRKRLARHRADLDARVWRLQRTAHRLAREEAVQVGAEQQPAPGHDPVQLVDRGAEPGHDPEAVPGEELRLEGEHEDPP